jgi:hypothetical protein
MFDAVESHNLWGRLSVSQFRENPNIHCGHGVGDHDSRVNVLNISPIVWFGVFESG